MLRLTSIHQEIECKIHMNFEDETRDLKEIMGFLWATFGFVQKRPVQYPKRSKTYFFFFQIMTVRELQGRETYTYMFETREEEILRHCFLKFSFWNFNVHRNYLRVLIQQDWGKFQVFAFQTSSRAAPKLLIPDHVLNSKAVDPSLPSVLPWDSKIWIFPACRKGRRMERGSIPLQSICPNGIRAGWLPGKSR